MNFEKGVSPARTVGGESPAVVWKVECGWQSCKLWSRDLQGPADIAKVIGSECCDVCWLQCFCGRSPRKPGKCEPTTNSTNVLSRKEDCSTRVTRSSLVLQEEQNDRRWQKECWSERICVKRTAKKRRWEPAKKLAGGASCGRGRLRSCVGTWAKRD